LFVAVEGQNEVRPRLQAVINEKVKPTEGKADDAKPIDAAGAPFAWLESCPMLASDEALPRLRQIVGTVAAEMEKRFELPLALVIIDTLSPAAAFKDANDTSENQRVMSVLTAIAFEFQTVVVAVDHFGKDVTTGTRNSSAKEASVDAVLALLGDRDLAGNVTNPRLALRKARGAPTGDEIPFAKREVSLYNDLTTLVIDWAAPSTPAGTAQPKVPRKWSKSLAVFRRALNAVMSSFGRKMRPFPDGPEVLTVERDKVREEFIKSYPADNLKAKGEAFRRCERDAVASRMIVSRDVGSEVVVTVFWLLADDVHNNSPTHPTHTQGTSSPPVVRVGCAGQHLWAFVDCVGAVGVAGGYYSWLGISDSEIHCDRAGNCRPVGVGSDRLMMV
jgi:hypothetical protein